MSFEKVLEMRAKRMGLVNEARAVLDAAEAEKRELSAEERQKYDKIVDDARTLKEKAERDERQLAMESELRGLEGSPAATSPKGQESAEERNIKAFRSYLINGTMTTELRSLVNDTDAKGGYLHAPEQYMAELLKGIDNSVFVRQFARILPVTTSDSLGVPTLATDLSDTAWSSEIAAVPEDTSMSFGKRELKPELLSKLVKVSMKLLRTSAIPIENLILERLSYKFSVAQENAYMNGTGTAQPLGVFTASNNGIPASRDISAGNTATAITADGLLNAKYALKQQYRSRASVRWCLHRDIVADIAKLKDNNGQYIWRPGIEMGQPDRLLNIPIDESEYAPSVKTTGLYVGILADWSYYWIAELHGLEIQRLNELYAGTSQVGFIGRQYVDGAPVLAEAFARVKLA